MEEDTDLKQSSQGFSGGNYENWTKRRRSSIRLRRRRSDRMKSITKLQKTIDEVEK